jgi:hypothetical protein
MLARLLFPPETGSMFTSPISRLLLTIAASFALTQCHTTTVPHDLDKPLFGNGTMTTFVVETDRALKLDELVHVARVLRIYKELTPAEMTVIAARLREEVNDLVEVEVKSLRPSYEKQKAVMKAKHAETLDATKGNPAVSARLAVIHAAELQRLEATMKQQARERVMARLGKDLALPLRTEDQRSVIAIGRMTGEQFQVTSKAYEIDVAVSKLASGAVVTTLEGGKAKVVGKPAQ